MSPSAHNIISECGKAYYTRNECLIASVINLVYDDELLIQNHKIIVFF